MPFFSIILPTYNRAHLLPRAISSALRQTFQDWELVIADDGSTDETANVVAEYLRQDQRIKFFVHEHCGLARTRNFGLQHAQGEYVTFLDSDDEYEPGHLQKRFEFLTSHPETELLHGGVNIIGDEYVADKFDPTRKIHLSECVIGGTFVIRRELVQKLGGFPIVDYGDDNAFFALAEKNGAVIRKIDAPTYIYHREEPDSMCAIVERDGIEALREFQNKPAEG